MSVPITIPSEFQEEIIRRNKQSQDWIDQLPETLETLSRKWALSWNDRPAFGRTGLVVPVDTSFGQAALKLISPAGNVKEEARALNLFAGKAIVHLLNVALPERALLLERLDSSRSIHTLPPEVAVTIAGEIANNLATAVAPIDIPSLTRNAQGWEFGIREQHERARSQGAQVPEQQLEGAVEAILALTKDTTDTMTHGDLSLDNIMKSSTGAWVAIDPQLTSGPIIHEAHTVVRSLLPLVLASDTPQMLMADLTMRFCNASGADYEGAQRLSLARYVASYYWESQNNGDPANISRLRRAADLTFRILQ